MPAASEPAVTTAITHGIHASPAAKARSSDRSATQLMPSWNATATNPQTPPIKIVRPNRRWRSVGLNRVLVVNHS